ncbi:MAG: hypothetical protein AAF556_00095 [Pseudomonadota bacterium]
MSRLRRLTKICALLGVIGVIGNVAVLEVTEQSYAEHAAAREALEAAYPGMQLRAPGGDGWHIFKPKPLMTAEERWARFADKAVRVKGRATFVDIASTNLKTLAISTDEPALQAEGRIRLRVVVEEALERTEQPLREVSQIALAGIRTTAVYGNADWIENRVRATLADFDNQVVCDVIPSDVDSKPARCWLGAQPTADGGQQAGASTTADLAPGLDQDLARRLVREGLVIRSITADLIVPPPPVNSVLWLDQKQPGDLKVTAFDTHQLYLEAEQEAIRERRGLWRKMPEITLR